MTTKDDIMNEVMNLNFLKMDQILTLFDDLTDTEKMLLVPKLHEKIQATFKKMEDSGILN